MFKKIYAIILILFNCSVWAMEAEETQERGIKREREESGEITGERTRKRRRGIISDISEERIELPPLIEGAVPEEPVTEQSELPPLIEDAVETEPQVSEVFPSETYLEKLPVEVLVQIGMRKLMFQLNKIVEAAKEKRRPFVHFGTVTKNLLRGEIRNILRDFESDKRFNEVLNIYNNQIINYLAKSLDIQPIIVAILINLETSRKYLDKNVNETNVNSPVNGPDGRVLPITYAIVEGSDELVNFFIKKGANLEESFGHFNTPLMEAIRLQKLNMTKILLNNGVNPNYIKVGISEKSPLIQAISWRVNPDIVKMLLERGADPNLEVKPYGKPLTLARELLDKIKSGKSWVPIMPEHKKNMEKIIELLEEYGATE